MTEQSLKEKTAKGLFWGGFSNGIQQLLNLLFGIVLLAGNQAERRKEEQTGNAEDFFHNGNFLMVHPLERPADHRKKQPAEMPVPLLPSSRFRRQPLPT